jgi:hypothetical protein
MTAITAKPARAVNARDGFVPGGVEFAFARYISGDTGIAR